MRTSALGSLPGTDAGAGGRLALAAVSVPWLPEFPARGPWAGMVGRAAGLLDGRAAVDGRIIPTLEGRLRNDAIVRALAGF